MKKRRKRICAKMLCICLMLSLASVPVSAAETGETVGSHEHTSECYTWTGTCTHEHTPECYSQENISVNEATPSEADEPIECSHICSVESGCITKESNFQYDSGTPATSEIPQENEAATPSNAQEAAAVLGSLSVPMLTASGTAEVSTADALDSALADSSISRITLTGNIEISSTLTVDRTVTLDLNGFVLRMTGNGSVIRVEQGGNLTTEDSNTTVQHKFTSGSDGLWVLDETNGTKTVTGGVLIGGKANDGGGVYVETGGQLTMTGGNIVGCSATGVGGGVYLNGLSGSVDQTVFTMANGSITGCFAANSDGGGGVNVARGTFTMNGGSITECTSGGYGGGVHIRNGGSFTMSGGSIQNCKSSGARSNGGGVYVGNGQFTMNGGSIAGCQAEGTSGNEEFARGGGVYNHGSFTMNGGSIESDCTADGSGGGVYNEKTLYANGGEIAGDVVNGIPKQTTGTITGTGGTKFSGKVTNNKGDRDDKSVIECGIFTGEVANDGGMISGGTFTGTVTNNEGTVLSGDFSGAILNGMIVITFDPNNGEQTSTQKMNWSKDGATLTAPTPAPAKEGYTLDGWYYDNSGTAAKWDFDTDKVKYTMTFTAQWKESLTAGETKEVSTAAELTSALGNSANDTVKLTADITIDATLTVNRTVALDLNGHVLRYKNDEVHGSTLAVEDGVHLTIKDSDPTAEHKFAPNSDGLWVLDEENGTETVFGGIITGGTGYPVFFNGGSGTYSFYNYYGGAVYIADGQLTLTGGSIVGCSATDGGGVCMNQQTGQMGQFLMTGGSIIGCVASDGGGGVYANGMGSVFNMGKAALIRDCRSVTNGGGVRILGTFQMADQAAIRGCIAESTTEFVYGGGVFVNSSSQMIMSDQAVIENCQAISSKTSQGGGVYIANGASLTLSDSAVLQNCTAENPDDFSKSDGGGVYGGIVEKISLEGSARIEQCNAANGSGLYITGTGTGLPGYGDLYANGGSVDGDVVLGDAEDSPCIIKGTGGTKFNGKVTVAPGSTIEKGTFNGKVVNNGKITGGKFTGAVSNNSKITGGTFTDTVINSESGTIENGTFTGEVVNNGTITGGTFTGTVINSESGTIGNGTFNGKVINNGTITGGEFTGTVSNNGSITGGTFTGTVINSESGTIAEGVSISNLKFIVTFDNEGTKTQAILDAGGKLTEPTAPTKDGYCFDGWYYTKDDNTEAKWNFGTNMVTHAMTLTAQWKKTIPSTPIIPGDIRYIVEHYKVSDSGYTLEETEYSTGKIGDTVTAMPKTYDGFTYNPSISTSCGTLKKITSAVDIVTLKLYYDRTVYTVTVENDGNGVASAAPASATMGDEITLTAAPNSGCRFKAWEVVSGGVTISNNKFIMPAGNVTVKAIFEHKSGGGSGGGGSSTYYTMNFHTNGGSSISAIWGTYGKMIDLSNYIPTRAGYDFTGWYSDQGLTQKITELRMNGSRTIYAGWIKSDPNTVMNPFTDVYRNDQFYNNVMFVYEKGLMSGISATAFAPYTNITRAQIAAIFYRMEGSPVVEGKNNFIDVEYGPGTVWFYDAVTWAQKNGIMGDCGGNKFGPDDPVTREQLASIFYRYAQVKGYDTTQNGMAAGSDFLDMKGTVTRAETAEMLHRFVEKQGLKSVAAPTGATEWVKPTS